VQRIRYVTLPNMVPVLIFAIITGVIAALQYFTEAAVASSVASGQSGVSVQLSQVLGYPSNSLLTYTEWLYVRGFSNFQLGYAAALAVVLFVITSIFLTVLMRQFKAFSPEGTS
jgi:multiple sugar transport system permease protein